MDLGVGLFNLITLSDIWHFMATFLLDAIPLLILKKNTCCYRTVFKLGTQIIYILRSHLLLVRPKCNILLLGERIIQNHFQLNKYSNFGIYSKPIHWDDTGNITQLLQHLYVHTDITNQNTPTLTTTLVRS